MALTTIGALTVGGTVPGVLAALLASVTDLQARIAAYAGFQVSIVPPSLAADIQVCESMLVGLKFNLALGVQAPSIDLGLQLVLDAVLLLNLQLQIIQALFELFATAGVYGYAYAGTVAGAGADLTAALAGGLPGGSGSDACNALILITTIGATWTAMAQVFQVTP